MDILDSDTEEANHNASVGRRRELLSPGATALKKAVDLTNDYIAINHGKANMFATLFVGIVNLKDGTLTYANCGNERPILGGAGREVRILQVTGPVVGIFPWAQHTVQETIVGKGDTLLIFTDGIPDAHNEANLEFGKEPVLKMMATGSDSATCKLDEIAAKVHAFIGPSFARGSWSLASRLDDTTGDTILQSKKRLVPVSRGHRTDPLRPSLR